VRLLEKLPCLLVLDEKHGDRYFLIPDRKTLEKVALFVVTERFKQGYWYNDPRKYKPEPLVMTEAALDSLPEAIREDARKKITDRKKALREWQREMDRYEEIETAVSEHDGGRALAVLIDRQDHEYEGWRIEKFETPEARRKR